MSFIRIFLSSCALLLLHTACERSPKKDEKPSDSATATPSVAQEKKDDKAAPDASAEEKQEAPADGTAEKVAEKIAAVFQDGTKITQEEVLKRVVALPKKIQGLPFTQLYNLVLFVMVQERLAYEAAVREDFHKKENILKQLEMVKEGIVRQYFIEQEAKKGVTDEAIKTKHDEMCAKFTPEDEIGIRHILFKTEEEAKSAISKCQKKEATFDALQKEAASKDPKTANKPDSDGILGFFRKMQLPPQYADEIMVLKPGEVFGKPVAVPPHGFSVISVTEQRKTTPPKLEDAKDRISASLIRERSLSMLDGLYKKHEVTLFDPAGKAVAIDAARATVTKMRSNLKKGVQPTDEDLKNDETLNSLRDNSVVAKIGGVSITFSQVSDFIKENAAMFRGMPLYVAYMASIIEYVTREVVRLEIKGKGLEDVPEVQTMWLSAKMALMAQKWLAKEAAKEVTDEKLREQYDNLMKNVDKAANETNVRVIQVKSEEEGKKAIKKAGTSFEEALKEFSTSDELAKKEGRLGYLNDMQLKERFGENWKSVASAATGTVLPSVVADAKGNFFVVKVDDRRKTELPPFAKVKAELKQYCIPEGMIAITQKLIAASGVKAFDFAGNLMDLSKGMDKIMGGVGPGAL
jgi:peptidyl-prolyl cis-trans isomerase C